MKRLVRSLFLLAGCCLLASSIHAGTDDKAVPPTTEDVPPLAPEPSHLNLPLEFDVSDAYVGSADVRRDGRDRSLDEQNSLVRLVFTPRVIPRGDLRLGVEWERYSFGFSDDAPLPNTLQEVNLVVGADVSLTDSILVRFEAQPGLYGTFFNHVTNGDFNVPFVLGGSYLYSDSLQFFVGIGVDVNRKYPVLPGVGFRYKVSPKLVIDAQLPAPRVEYELSKSTTLFAGAEFKDDNFRVDEHFGDNHLDNRHDERVLNHALVTFSEIRAGVGLTQRFSPSLTLTLDGGCQPYREFDFHRADARYRSDGLAPYGQIALHGAF